MRKLFLIPAILLLPVAAAADEHAPTQPRSPAPILALKDVKPGMEAIAWTVFQGTQPEPFKLRVEAVLPNFIPGQSVILIRALDPRVAHTGIAAGMSGSPVYVDGKLMGAVAYSWSFLKDPLGGVTPIESMLKEGQRPRRRNPELQQPETPLLADQGTPSQWYASALNRSPVEQRAQAARSYPVSFPASAAGAGDTRLIPAGLSLSVAGVPDRVLADLEGEFTSMGLVPVRTGAATASGTTDGGVVQPGGAIGVALARGPKIALVATGTVTYVNGNQVLAFGHPMFGQGEAYLPLVNSEIFSIIPSMTASFKLAAPLREVGALVFDRTACIVGDLGLRAGSIPVAVKIQAPGVPPSMSTADVAFHKRLTPTLVSMVVASAATLAEPDAADTMVTVTTRLDVRGYGQLELTDRMFSTDGLSARALGNSRGLGVLSVVLTNPFEAAAINRIEVDASVAPGRDTAEIISVSAPSKPVRAGDVVPLQVTLRPFGGRDIVQTLNFTVPHGVEPGVLRVEIAAGSQVRPDVPRIENLRGFLDSVKKLYGANELVASLATPDDGVSLRGRMVPGLPAVALDTLATGTATPRTDRYRVTDRVAFPAARVVSGRQEVSLYIRPDSLGRR